MKKYLLSFGLIIAFALYVVLQNQGQSQVAGGLVASNNATTSAGTAGTPPAPAPQPASAGLYKDGGYTGSAADAYYGTVQVQAVVSGGRLADVKMLQEPNAPGHTSEVSGMAIPYLVQEAVAAQSASINLVSGATQTSEAFMQSLASALSQASSS